MGLFSKKTPKTNPNDRQGPNHHFPRPATYLQDVDCRPCGGDGVIQAGCKTCKSRGYFANERTGALRDCRACQGQGWKLQNCVPCNGHGLILRRS
ncbi:hypothetical protein AB0H63_21965 [Micromonospora echinospora]|uniref:hypothetical protein n=1 Tax=Micromonospora echinospora TaxID=1877 RepID=UPI0033C28A5B